MRTLNLGVVAHVDAGKTTLTERLLYNAGVIEEIGSVDEGSTQTDTLELERRRGITIRSAVVSFAIDDVTVNLVDTPGHPDFIAEVDRALGVLDGCVVVVSAVEGVQAQSVILMRALRRLHVPTLLFVNKIDRAGADPDRVVAQIRRRLSPAVFPMGSVRRVGGRGATFVPFDWGDEAFRQAVVAQLAEQDEQFLEAFVEGDAVALAPAVVRRAAERRTREARLHPVFFGSAITGAGVDELGRSVPKFLPASSPDEEQLLSAVVFKVERESAGQRVAYIRVFSGRLTVRGQVELRGRRQRVTAIAVCDRGRWEDMDAAVGGQIARVRGLVDVQIGDTVGQPRRTAAERHFAAPSLEAIVLPRRADQRGAMAAALRQMEEQDPLIRLRQDPVVEELAVSLYGEVQKEVLEATLAGEYGVEVEFGETTTICIERPTGVGRAIEVIRRNPFLATVGLRAEPARPGAGIEFRLDVEVGTVPLYVYSAVDAFDASMGEYVRDGLRQGLFGWEVTDCIVTMTDSAYVPSGTIAADFRKLTPLVLMTALRRAGTVVCEPIHRFRLESPDDLLGALLPRLTRMGAVPRGTSVDGTVGTIEGVVRAADVHQLQQRVPGWTRGEGVLETEFDRYEPVRGTPPERRRHGPNPLSRKQYFSEVRR